jgi:hypothetical protein
LASLLNPAKPLLGGYKDVNDSRWSASEKKIARRAFDAALDNALAKVMAEFKAKAAAATRAAASTVSWLESK